MKNFTLILALILVLSLVVVTNTYPRHSNNALREQLLDYLLEVRRQELLHNKRKQLEKSIEQFQENYLNDDENSDSSDSENIRGTRAKAVGLGDNPY